MSHQIKVTYVDHMGDDLRVVNAARISFNNEKEILDDKDKKLIKYLADNEHMSPFEHNILTVIIECPLYIRSQIMRHRSLSFNEISRRYTSENLEFYLPEKLKYQSLSNRQASDEELDKEESDDFLLVMNKHHESSLILYEHLLKYGVAREQARGILPQNLMTKFYATGNLRGWAHFVKLRDDAHAQYEVTIVAKQVKDLMMEKFPEATKALLE